MPSTYSNIKAEELGEAGVNIIIYANHMLRSSYPAMARVANDILKHSSSHEVENDCMKIKEIINLIPST